MDISYFGHSCFKLRSKNASLITDPFSSKIGFSLPRISADVVTVSHAHSDHNNFEVIAGTARRSEPFIIKYPGEYEVSEISVFGIHTFHDAKEGAERGSNIIFVIHIDELTCVHLGDLGHILTDRQIEEISEVDILLIPVGGVYTIDSSEAIEVIHQLQPSLVCPMHYKTKRHSQDTFGSLASLEEFLDEGGFEKKEPLEKFSVTKTQLPEEMEVLVFKV